MGRGPALDDPSHQVIQYMVPYCFMTDMNDCWRACQTMMQKFNAYAEMPTGHGSKAEAQSGVLEQDWAKKMSGQFKDVGHVSDLTSLGGLYYRLKFDGPLVTAIQIEGAAKEVAHAIVITGVRAGKVVMNYPDNEFTDQSINRRWDDIRDSLESRYSATPYKDWIKDNPVEDEFVNADLRKIPMIANQVKGMEGHKRWVHAMERALKFRQDRAYDWTSFKSLALPADRDHGKLWAWNA